MNEFYRASFGTVALSRKPAFCAVSLACYSRMRKNSDLSAVDKGPDLLFLKESSALIGLFRRSLRVKFFMHFGKLIFGKLVAESEKHKHQGKHNGGNQR